MGTLDNAGDGGEGAAPPPGGRLMDNPGRLVVLVVVLAVFAAACRAGTSASPAASATSTPTGGEMSGAFPADYKSEVYVDDAQWLCRPGLTPNPCEEDLDLTVIEAEGSDLGGSFDQIPACRSPDQVGCVIFYSSFRSTAPQDDASYFGRTDQEGMEVLCTNPADLTGGSAALEPYVFDEPSQFTPEPFDPWAAGVADSPAVATPFVALRGLITSVCVDDGESQFLELTLVPDPGPRVDDLAPGILPPEWGMQLLDVTVALGDLIDIVETQGAA